MEKESESIAHVTLSDSGEFAGDRDFILDYRLTGQEINCGLMLNTGEKENFFMLMVQPPERVRAEEIPPREYIFVLDVSGSMFGYPLDTAKELIGNLVGNLRDSDQFNLILFSDTAVSMAPKSVPATAENIRQAIDLIERQDGGGGTELAPALEQAVSLPRDPRMARSIVTITDGYMSDESSIFSLINRNLKTADFFSFGIGTSVNRYLIDGIAKAGSGEAFVVTEPSQASDTARDFSTYIQSPVMTGINVSFDGFDVYDVEPDILPTLFAQRPIVLFGKWPAFRHHSYNRKNRKPGLYAGNTGRPGRGPGRQYGHPLSVGQDKGGTSDRLRHTGGCPGCSQTGHDQKNSHTAWTGLQHDDALHVIYCRD